MFLVKKGISLLTFPLGALFLAIAVAAVLRWRKIGEPWPTRVIVASIIAVILCCTGPTGDLLIGPLERAHPVLSTDEIAALNDGPVVIAVLGGGLHNRQNVPVTSELTDSSTIRLAEGLRLFHLFDDATLVVSGAADLQQRSTADAMAELATGLGLPPDRFLQADRARDTAEEARALSTLLPPDASLILVTEASHMPRSMRLFEREGLSPTPAPTYHRASQRPLHPGSMWPSARNLRKVERAFYEYLALTWVTLGGS